LHNVNSHVHSATEKNGPLLIQNTVGVCQQITLLQFIDGPLPVSDILVFAVSFSSLLNLPLKNSCLYS
jgi:hypothetical protein